MVFVRDIGDIFSRFGDPFRRIHPISPEQAKGTEVDVRSDIYSLGVSLYHMVVGDTPFSGDDDFEVMSKQIMQTLRISRSLTPLACSGEM